MEWGIGCRRVCDAWHGSVPMGVLGLFQVGWEHMLIGRGAVAGQVPRGGSGVEGAGAGVGDRC
jgi:hypothetical protein